MKNGIAILLCIFKSFIAPSTNGQQNQTNIPRYTKANTTATTTTTFTTATITTAHSSDNQNININVGNDGTVSHGQPNYSKV